MQNGQQEGPVAVLGCGLMGSAVIRALVGAGHDLVIWNRTPAKADALVGDRVRAVPTAREAVEAAPVVISVLTDDDAVRQALTDTPLSGRTLVNLTQGSPAQVVEAQEWVTARGARYLDGVIMAYPADIGGEDTVVNYSGPADVHRALEPVLRALGGASRYLGEDVRAAAVLDVAAVGLFTIPALTSYAESTSFALAHAVPVEVLEERVDRSLRSLRRQMLGILRAVASGDHATDQATADTYGTAAHHFLEAVAEAGHRSRQLEAAVASLDDVRHAGEGDLGISAVAAHRPGGS
ncbi:NAD(P)-dependent oxidoreductase [Blastococcus sp. SYSU D00695]